VMIGWFESRTMRPFSPEAAALDAFEAMKGEEWGGDEEEVCKKEGDGHDFFEFPPRLRVHCSTR